jgi:hypothetical protein
VPCTPRQGPAPYLRRCHQDPPTLALHCCHLTRLSLALRRSLPPAFHRDCRVLLQFAGVELSLRKTTSPGALRDLAARPPPLLVASGLWSAATREGRVSQYCLLRRSLKSSNHLDSPTRVSTYSISPCSLPSVLSLNRTPRLPDCSNHHRPRAPVRSSHGLNQG